MKGRENKTKIQKCRHMGATMDFRHKSVPPAKVPKYVIFSLTNTHNIQHIIHDIIMGIIIRRLSDFCWKPQSQRNRQL